MRKYKRRKHKKRNTKIHQQSRDKKLNFFQKNYCNLLKFGIKYKCKRKGDKMKLSKRKSNEIAKMLKQQITMYNLYHTKESKATIRGIRNTLLILGIEIEYFEEDGKINYFKLNNTTYTVRSMCEILGIVK